MKDRSLLDHVQHDILGSAPDFKARAMFGGFGVYWDGRIFAIFDDGTFYFKVNDELRPEFEKRDSQPFSYPMKDGTTSTMNNYWSLPDEILDDRDELLEWIKRSAALSKPKS